MDDVAIKVENVSKVFKLPHEKQTSLKGAVINIFKGGRSSYERQQVLNDISFEIKKGEFFGIVGRNGSGKSTLLKMLAGIYTPTSGSIRVNGKLTPFIELGVGFNPELTGRENVFLNGALLGFNRSEMLAMYDDIVEFAELGKFMGQKLKNYSSGMQVRLGFSIAVRASTDILVLDEVLAVGDEAFQNKCFQYFDQLKREKRTVVLVTHDMNSVERYCNRALFIESGSIELEGEPYKVAAAYSRRNSLGSGAPKNTTNQAAPFSIEVLDSNGKAADTFDYLDKMTVRLSWEQKDVKGAGVAIFRGNGEYVFGPNTHQDKYKLQADNRVEYTVALNLNEGDYFIKAGLTGANDQETIAFIEEGPHFAVRRDYEHGRWGGVTKLNHKWQ